MISLTSSSKGRFFFYLVFSLLFLSSAASLFPRQGFALTLTVTSPEAEAIAVVDSLNGTVYKKTMPGTVYLPTAAAALFSDMLLILKPTSYNPDTGQATIHLNFRLEDIPLEHMAYYSAGDDSIMFTGYGVSDFFLTITSSSASSGSGSCTFSATMEVNSGYLNLPYTLTLPTDYAKFELSLSEPYRLVKTRHEEGSLDYWYQLFRVNFPENEPASSFSFKIEKESGATVVIAGQNVEYSPAVAITDADGIFGVAAYVDPESVPPASPLTPGHIPFEARNFSAAAATSSGTLEFRHNGYTAREKISGYYCEVVLVEGTVRVVGGTGTVKKGDVLRPGTKLSLAADYGNMAQIALRFINGSEMQLLQDVYTNACVADIIVIGKSGFVNQSVIQGQSRLASVSRSLCEHIAGMPNTPDEWGHTAGRFAVKTAVSSIVPGSGFAAFAIKYAVGKVTGKVYDSVVSTEPNDAVPELRSLTSASASTGSGNDIIIDLYHDGSTRLATNISEGVSISLDTLPSYQRFYTLYPGNWIEVIDQGTTGRLWGYSINEINQNIPQSPNRGFPWNLYFPAIFSKYE